MTSKDAALKIDNKSISLPVQQSTIGVNAIDVTQLYKVSGYYSYDANLMSTAVCKSAITYIDGNRGILRYRGYDIQDLASKCSFLEVCYLLIYGDLPAAVQYDNFEQEVKHHSLLNEQLRNLFMAFRHSAHPMAITLSAVGSLSAFYHDELDAKDIRNRELAAIRIIAKMPTIAAMSYKYSIGQPFMYPNNSLGFAENFLYMMHGTPCEKYIPNITLARVLEQMFILHADHEQNASTFTVKTAGSSGANPFACIAAGIASLWGQVHGGANESVVTMLQNIGNVNNVTNYVNSIKANKTKLMGFGHRIYKNYDPRAVVLKQIYKQILQESRICDNHMFEVATRLEEIALSDEYFISHNLYPNVDFYSGIIYQLLGIPTHMFTVMFAVARVSGWIAQWKEMIENPESKIYRPRQLYTGPPSREFIAMSKR